MDPNIFYNLMSGGGTSCTNHQSSGPSKRQIDEANRYMNPSGSDWNPGGATEVPRQTFNGYYLQVPVYQNGTAHYTQNVDWRR
jgi:hypothetical protein